MTSISRKINFNRFIFFLSFFLQAGESPLSFCCTSTGKKAKNSEFEDYENCTFAADDVITAMIDFTGNQVQISFMKNGDALGNAFAFPKSQLSGKFLFPHVSSRNAKFEVNFGKAKDGSVQEPAFPLPAGFKMAADCLGNASRGAAR